jgi:hypothetical protein
LLCLALALPGCIFAEPPEHNPRQTPIFFDLDGASPLTTKLVEFAPQDVPREFTVPLRSEDAGEQVWWAVQENFNIGGTGARELGLFEPSNLNDTSRVIRFRYDPGQEPASCTQLTLMACHFRYFDLSTFRCSTAQGDAAYAVWWVTFSELSEPSTLDACPQPTTP